MEPEKNATDDEEIYPCAECGLMRSKNQGGTIFTLCDECWDKHYKKLKDEANYQEDKDKCHQKTNVKN
jgi:hypothetical protein